MTSAFKINTKPGSEESIKWLEAMQNVKTEGNEEVFLSKFALIVDYKWSKVRFWVFLEGALYFGFYFIVAA